LDRFVGKLLYLFLTMRNIVLLFFGVPLFVVFLQSSRSVTGLYPTEVRGTAQGVLLQCRPSDRSAVPGNGRFSQRYDVSRDGDRRLLASGVTIVMLFTVPKTRGRSLATLEAAPAD